MRKLKTLLFVVGVVACTDAQLADYDSLSKPHTVKCWSGTLLIYEGETTGTVANEQHSDGWYFKEAKSGNVVHVGGSCVLTVKESR